MRKNYSFSIPLFISLFILMASPPAVSQNNIAVEFQGFSSGPKIMKLGYSIPFGGVVEIQLYDSSGKLVYENRFVRDEGTHHIPMRRSGFKPGESYSYTIKYKFSAVSGDVPL